MRTLTSKSRTLSAASILVAAALVLAGAYFAGYISELQRDLSDPAVRQQVTAQSTLLEKALGYDGFLKVYRNFRLTGDAAARTLMNRQADKAKIAIENLRLLYASNPAALEALREAGAIGEAFAHVARTAPETGAVALRGTAAMDSLNSLPQSPQLEAAYISLRGALDRLKQAEQAHQLGDVASVLSWSQMLILGALASLVLGLLVVAALLHLGIIQPLKSLEQSLSSVGAGNVGHHIWGTDRTDEFGELARAGEKLRLSLTETTALKALAENSQLRINLEGQGSVLFEKLAAEVTSAAEALRGASVDLAKIQTDDRGKIDAALARLNQSSAGVDDVAKTLHRDGTAAIHGVLQTTDQFLASAKQRADRLDQIATRYESGGQKLESVAAEVKASSAHVVDELANATGSIKRLADGAQQIQNAFFSTCDKISTDAAGTTDKVRTLAIGLSDAIGNVDDRLGKKLIALDQLEQSLSGALSKLQASTDDTINSLSRAVGVLDERGTANETRIDKTVGEFEEVLRNFRDDKAALNQSAASAVAHIKHAQFKIADAAETRQEENRQFVEATARLQEIAERLTVAPSTEAPSVDALATELQAFAQSVGKEMEAVRQEIRDMAVRMTEERIMSAAALPVFTAPGNGALLENNAAHRSLADVPGAELMTRLKDLAEEMNAAQGRVDQTQSLKTALGAFASDIKVLAPGADRAARLISMGKALDHHAGEIETHATAIEPSAVALRTELHAITSELRTIAAHAQSNGAGKDAPSLRESAIELGARAESLFSYLENTHHEVAGDDEEGGTPDTIDATSADIAALARLISRLESRAESLSQNAVAARFDDVSDDRSPSEREAIVRNAELKTGGAIHTVFESIERLNNIAAALARATDAERLRKVAH
ncbi:MAG: hypothetical protein K8S25_13575 [Alphaproteobacteria bacterium]|nr:hypothetical protein [Alphaproteobacteria bacterium]